MKKQPSDLLSPGQQRVLAIILPILILLSTYTIMPESARYYMRNGYMWLFLDKTSLYWLMAFTAVGVVEFWLFRPRN